MKKLNLVLVFLAIMGASSTYAREILCPSEKDIKVDYSEAPPHKVGLFTAEVGGATWLEPGDATRNPWSNANGARKIFMGATVIPSSVTGSSALFQCHYKFFLQFPDSTLVETYLFILERSDKKAIYEVNVNEPTKWKVDAQRLSYSTPEDDKGTYSIRDKVDLSDPTTYYDYKVSNVCENNVSSELNCPIRVYKPSTTGITKDPLICDPRANLPEVAK